MPTLGTTSKQIVHLNHHRKGNHKGLPYQNGPSISWRSLMPFLSNGK